MSTLSEQPAKEQLYRTSSKSEHCKSENNISQKVSVFHLNRKCELPLKVATPLGTIKIKTDNFN